VHKFLAQVTAVAVLLSSGLGTLARRFEVLNNCPSDIVLTINDEEGVQIPLAAGTAAARSFPDADNVFFFTLSNGGNNDGTGFARAIFHGAQNYYFLAVDPNHLNAGIRIIPEAQPAADGFCPAVQCDSATCSTAFTLSNIPTTFPKPVPGIPPKAPLFECPGSAGYNITFCPTGKFPNNPPAGQAVHPKKNAKKCLDVRGGVFKNGTPVQIFDCNNTPAQQWALTRGSTKVKLVGTNFCLDAGSTPGNGVGMKIWQCFDNLPAQQWFFTDDNRIALEGKGLCLDLTNGVTTNSNRVQTWKCTNGNQNQIWN